MKNYEKGDLVAHVNRPDDLLGVVDFIRGNGVNVVEVDGGEAWFHNEDILPHTLTEAQSLPLPTTSFMRYTVVASAWRNDTAEDGEIAFVLLLLTPIPNAHYITMLFSGVTSWEYIHGNVVDAVRDFADLVGS